jgi:hypothetical protein
VSDAPKLPRDCTYGDRGLVPVVRVRNSTVELPAETQHLLAPRERLAVLRCRPIVAERIRQSLALLPDDVPPPTDMALHVWPCLGAEEQSRFRYVHLSIDHRRWFWGGTRGIGSESVLSGFSDDDYILSFRDRDGVLHLPLDCFLPNVNGPLQKALAAQAILGALVDDADALPVRLKDHTVSLLHRAEIFDFPRRDVCLGGADSDRWGPLLGLHTF